MSRRSLPTSVRTAHIAKVGGGGLVALLCLSAAACSSGKSSSPKTTSPTSSSSSTSTTSSSSSSSTPSEALVTTTPAATGDVDKVTWGLGRGEPTTIDPAKTGDYSPNTVVENMCESLLQLQPDFSIKPGLSTSHTQPDATTIVFTIRSGVKFWDGHVLTPADVAFSLNRERDPKTQAVNAGVFASVASIKATGAHQVTIKFTRPDSQFLSSIAGVSGDVSEQAFVQKKGAAYGTPTGGVMCTGPFAFSKWAAGDRLVMTRNDSYWGTKAKAKEFDFVFLNDDSTLTSGLLAGQIQGAYEAPVGSLGSLSKSKTGKLYFGPSTESLSLGPTSTTGPAADPRVREAIDMSLDKAAIIKNLLKGAGSPLKTFTPPLVWNGSAAKSVYDAGYAALPDPSPVDLAKAKQLVTAAGAAGKTMTLAIVSGDQLGQQVAVVTQAAVAKIGLKITIKQMQPTAFSQLFYDPSKRQSVDLIVATGYVEVPGALYYAPPFALKGGLFNWTGYSNPTVTAKIASALSATDPQTSAKDFVAAQAIFASQRLQISLALIDERLYMNDKITGAPASFAYISSPWAASVGSAG